MDLDLVTTLRSTGAVRAFRSDALPDDVVFRVLDSARFAPSGGNRQGWRVVLVKDAAVRRSLRDLYLAGWYEYLSQRAAGLVPFAPVTDEAAEAAANADAGRLRGNGGDFAERLDEAPVLLVLLADLRVIAAVDKSLDRYTFAGGASVYPFAWSVLLAARSEGLGGVMTTMAIRREPDVKALLGVPDELAVAGLLVLGVPVHQPTRLTRDPVESFTTVDRHDGPPLRP
jgi:nitroreductase